MTSLVLRRLTGLFVVAIFAAMLWTLNFALAINLQRAEIFSGFTLFGLILLLSLLNARKKLPFLPLLSASLWLHLHIYAGLLSILLFLAHIGFRSPRGPLEVVLAVIFAVVALSGFFGLAISRWIPRQLTLHGESVIFERIPSLRCRLQKEVEELVIDCVAATGSSTLADFYEANLRRYFLTHRHAGSHLLGSSKPLKRLLAQIEAMDRYLSDEERKVMARLMEAVRTKDHLDFHLAGQGLLKGWLFVHIPFTYTLIILATVHGVCAWLF
jgi:hypothetical protein